jgi:hypothetical protein
MEVLLHAFFIFTVGGVITLAVRLLYPQLEGSSTHYVGCWVFVLNHWRYIYSDTGTVLMYGGWRFCSTLFLSVQWGGALLACLSACFIRNWRAPPPIT